MPNFVNLNLIVSVEIKIFLYSMNQLSVKNSRNFNKSVVFNRISNYYPKYYAYIIIDSCIISIYSSKVRASTPSSNDVYRRQVNTTISVILF